jgi:N-acetylneuraminate synthase
LGLPPKFLPEILGRATARDIAYGEPLSWNAVAND